MVVLLVTTLFQGAPSWFGQRHVMALHCFIGLTINYIMRFCLSIAITDMTSSSEIEKISSEGCPYPEGYIFSNTTQRLEFDWREDQQGLVNSAFFWGYIPSQIPGGVVADRIGARFVLSGGAAATSFFTLITPIITRQWEWQGLVVVRIFVGLSQGFFYSALATAVAQWIPKEERATWSSIVYSGVHTGSALNMLFTGLFLDHFKGSWDLIFYIFGTLGFCWVFVFLMTTYSSPEEHPGLSQNEKEILKNCCQTKEKKIIPWRLIFTSLPVWSIAIAMLGHDFGLFALITDLPKFMKSVLHFNIKKNGILNALTYILIWFVSLLAGMITDYVTQKGWMSTTMVRKIGTTIASVGPSLGFIASVYTGCDANLAVIYLIIGQALMGFFYPSLRVNPIDISPNYSGTVSSITTAFGSSAGLYVPYLIGALTPNNSLDEWRIVMWIFFAVMSITNIFYLFGASAELQSWNNPNSKNNNEQTEVTKI